MSNRAVFLDRDGTLNEEVSYLGDVSQLQFVGGAPEAVAQLNRSCFKVVVVTNQAGVARGFFSEDVVSTIHAEITEQLRKQEAHIDGFYFCPHHPTAGLNGYRKDCNCRKPKPGMLEKAAQDLSLDLRESFLVGDKRSDLEAGRAAGCRVVLVRTGYGRRTEEELSANGLPPDFIADDLKEATRWILRQPA